MGIDLNLLSVWILIWKCELDTAACVTLHLVHNSIQERDNAQPVTFDWKIQRPQALTLNVQTEIRASCLLL